MATVTLQTVADRVGVSRVTVSSACSRWLHQRGLAMVHIDQHPS